MNPKVAVYFNVHLVSDSTGETLNAVMRAACAQFDNIAPLEHNYYLVRSPKQLERVLKEIENDELALALKTASQDLQDKIFKNMSERAAQLVREDIQFMDPVKVSDVEAAQQRIVDVVRRLEEAGEVVIQGRGGDAELIV